MAFREFDMPNIVDEAVAAVKNSDIAQVAGTLKENIEKPNRVKVFKLIVRILTSKTLRYALEASFVAVITVATAGAGAVPALLLVGAAEALAGVVAGKIADEGAERLAHHAAILACKTNNDELKDEHDGDGLTSTVIEAMEGSNLFINPLDGDFFVDECTQPKGTVDSVACGTRKYSRGWLGSDDCYYCADEIVDGGVKLEYFDTRKRGGVEQNPPNKCVYDKKDCKYDILKYNQNKKARFSAFRAPPGVLAPALRDDS